MAVQYFHHYKTKNRAKFYCWQAHELYEKFCDCYTTKQLTAVIDDQYGFMQANKISVKGNLFFILNQYLHLRNILEDYIETLVKYNLKGASLETARQHYFEFVNCVIAK